MTADDREWYTWQFTEDKKRHKLKTDEELLQYYSAELMKAHAHWLNILDEGCNDPFWCDGSNMNLVRNHIIYFRNSIMNLCVMKNLTIPECFYEPVPPKTDSNYMAHPLPKNDHQRKRYDRIKEKGEKITSEKPKQVCNSQLSLF